MTSSATAPVTPPPPTADELARQVADAMFNSDTAARVTLGVEIVSVGEGRAELRMRVAQLHLNGHNICHGGFIFTLADTAFAYACNSRNRNTVAAAASIDFLRPARKGDVLTCQAIEQFQQGRQGVYDMMVTNQQGELIALFRGKSAQIPGTILPD
jgi:acyl-CoA thioesterase